MMAHRTLDSGSRVAVLPQFAQKCVLIVLKGLQVQSCRDVYLVLKMVVKAANARL